MKTGYLLLILMLLGFSAALSTNQPAIIPCASNASAVEIFATSYTAHDPIWIQGNQDFANQANASGWIGNGTSSNPYIISGCSFNQETQPLRIWNTNVYWIFAGNLITGVIGVSQCGIWIEGCSNGAILNNEIRYRHSAMYISDVENLTISGNYLHDCFGNGFEMTGGVRNCTVQNNIINGFGGAGIYSATTSDCRFRNNKISYCDSNGIYLLSGVHDCSVASNVIIKCEPTGITLSTANGCHIVNNTVSDVSSIGLFMNGALECNISLNIIMNISGTGIKLGYAQHSVVSHNLISNCSEDGFLLSSGTQSIFNWNTVCNTAGFAVNISPDCSNFSIMYNAFIQCGLTCQIYDDGVANIIALNYYSDWNSPDADGNGIVDIPYVIDGEAENQDQFPLAVEGIVPSITTESESTPDPLSLLPVAGIVAAIALAGIVLVLLHRRITM
jgi:parallel beta-helix repeat protein